MLVFWKVNMAALTSGFLPSFSVPVEVIVKAAIASAIVGLLSGGLPAMRATRLSVVDGLRRVV
jgi:ABC-type antimicrobial peptide transport system permease subunit